MSILSYRYGSHFRGGFSDEQLFYLRQSALLRQRLALAHNEFIQSLTRVILNHDTSAAQVHLEFIKNKSGSLNNQFSKAWRTIIKNNGHLFSGLTKEFYEKVKEILATSELFWPNKDAVYDDFMRSHRRAMFTLDAINFSSDLLPAKINHQTAGKFVYRFIRPVLAEDLLAGNGPVKLEFENPSNKYAAELTFPIATIKRGQYIDAKWPVTVHRPLMAGALVKSVSVHGQYLGSQWRLFVTFVLQKQGATPICIQSKKSSAIGIDVGWRACEDGLKVATACIGGSQYEHFFLPPKWLAGMAYVQQLDEDLTNSLKAITGVDRQWYLQGSKKESQISQWKQLHHALIAERNNKKARLARWRLDLYRQYGNEICRRANIVYMETLYLKPMMSVDSKQGPSQKRQQKMAAIGLFQKTIEEIALKHGCQIRYVSAKNTTRLHADCGFLNPVLKGPGVRCGGCQKEFNQDENASLLLTKGGATSFD